MHATKVALLFGGRSPEHAVSIRSAASVARALRFWGATRYDLQPAYLGQEGGALGGAEAEAVLQRAAPQALADAQDVAPLWQVLAQTHVVFPVLHGPAGEDGSWQGVCRVLGLPCVGPSLLAAALAADKAAMKDRFDARGLPQTGYRVLSRAELDAAAGLGEPGLSMSLANTYGLPMFVKAANSGSSIGVYRVTEQEALFATLREAARQDPLVVVEPEVVGRELEVAVIGFASNCKVSVIGEICHQSDFYDYDTKYTSGRAALRIPAALPAQIRERITDMARQAVQVLGVEGWARVDFFYQEAANRLYINEVNTMPGFTETSMFPRLWEASGRPWPEVVAQIVDDAQAAGVR
ncbi:MAG: D-alanine--D-alanine ligase family protein [Polyangiales bacterium]